MENKSNEHFRYLVHYNIQFLFLLHWNHRTDKYFNGIAIYINNNILRFNTTALLKKYFSYKKGQRNLT